MGYRDKDELNAVIEEAEAITAEGYTEDSYNALRERDRRSEGSSGK
ncbi:MAG: hypothetical protein ACLVJ6_09770 [Merdibacter sp.]